MRNLPWHWPVLAFWAAFWCTIMISRTEVGRGWNPSWHFAAGGARMQFQVPFGHGGGLVLLPIWAYTGVFWGHFDDVLALLFAVPGGWSRRSPKLFAISLTAAVVAALWLPFVIADPHTLNSLSGFTIRNTQDSALRALDVTGRGTPSWNRSAQILFGCALGVLAFWRRRWPAALLLIVCARLILEPGDYP